MIIINNLENLKKNKQTIMNIMNNKMKNFQLTFENLYCIHKSNATAITFISDKKEFITTLKKKNDSIMECCIEIEPIFINENEKNLFSYIQEIKDILNVKALYFPLVYENSLFYKLLNENNNLYEYKRLYTSIIQPKLIDNIYKYIRKYNVNKFEKNLFIKYYEKKDVINEISIIESNSWKSEVGQDMLTQKEKLIYYNELIKSGLAKIAVAFYKDTNEPIAYRIEAISNDTVYSLKTSFNENFRKYSPGTYLLIYDMINRYKNYKKIDLFGGPSLWKSKIETNRINRYDFCYGDEDVINKLKINREKWDQKNYNNFKEKKAIREIYNI